MRAEKQFISSEYLTRLNSSPFFIVVDYTGLRVGPMTELRKRLFKAGAEIHIVKNTLFRIAAKEAGVADLGASLARKMFPRRRRSSRLSPRNLKSRRRVLVF